jgi:hypothetical protein
MDRVRRYVRFFSKYLAAPLVTEPAPAAAGQVAE